ncbi:uncharacterized protein LOC117321904 [Pecten maximus]|uniref:uncharacterized protein LOC117321904 n=1 Tax=Pecten maximus TaxID=6579 RepID=UPI001458BB79|nr:uncharacterized protein LOC117321904 [Pecten maximus]
MALLSGSNDELENKMPFVGRRREVEEIKAWLRVGHHRLIQIYGPPFTGKQSLAKQIQNDIETECIDRKISLKCIESTGEFSRDWSEWLDELVNASGTPVSNGDSEYSIIKHIRQIANDKKLSRLLFVFTKIDNIICKPALQDRFVRFCQSLIRLSANIFMLVTSQKRIVFPSSLSVRATFLTAMTESEGITLLQNTARKSARDVIKHAPDIVRGCCYLPGLITEAVVLLDHPHHVVGMDDLVTIVQTPGSLMRMISFQKQKLQHFFDRMSENEKNGAMLLTLFKGSFSKSAANEILLSSRKAHDSASVSLVELCDQSVVSRCTDSDRYEVLPFLNEFLIEQIHNVSELNPARLQFTKFFCRILQSVEQKIYVHGRDKVMGHLHGDFDNVRQLMQQTMHCTQEIFPLLMQTVVSAEELFTACFPNREVKLFYDSLMDAASTFGTERDRALIFWLMAQNKNPYMKESLDNSSSDTTKSLDVLELCEAAHSVLQIEGPSYHLAAIKGLMGQTYNRRGNFKKARRLLMEALDMLSRFERSMTTTRREVTLMSHLAISEMCLENHSNSESTVDKGMQIACRETPYHPAIAVMLNTMGLIWENSGRSQVYAMRYYKWSLEERRKHSYFREENLVPALLNVSLQLIRTGKFSAAVNTLEEAIEIRKQYGWVNHFTAVTLYYIGIVQMQIGNFSLALDYNQQAFIMLEICTPEHFVVFKAIDAIAHCHLALKDEYNARRSFVRAIDKYQKYDTDDMTSKVCILRHCLLLGDSHQRQHAFSCLQEEFLKTSDTELNIARQISEIRDVHLANEEENWNENGRVVLSEHCSLCRNRYRVFPYCENDAWLQTNHPLMQSQKQPSESCDSSYSETDCGTSESQLRTKSDKESPELEADPCPTPKESLGSGKYSIAEPESS